MPVGLVKYRHLIFSYHDDRNRFESQVRNRRPVSEKYSTTKGLFGWLPGASTSQPRLAVNFTWFTSLAKNSSCRQAESPLARSLLYMGLTVDGMYGGDLKKAFFDAHQRYGHRPKIPGYGWPQMVRRIYQLRSGSENDVEGHQ